MTKYRPGTDRYLPQSEITEKKKRKKWPIVLIFVIDAILILILAGVLVFRHYTAGLTQVELDREDLGIVEVETIVDEEGNVIENHVVNIAMFGVDTRDESASYGDKGRSDSIIILSIDPDNNALKLTSILRDTKVPIEGHDPQKINAAYKYGQAPLAIKTLNQVFKLDIADYVTVDFGQLEKVVDIMGGVEIELTAEEAARVNEYSDAVMGYGNYDAKEGWNLLNGAQAVSYSRIRKIDSDYYRAGRQQVVLTALFNKVKGLPKSQYPETIRQLLSCVETSLTYVRIIELVNMFDLKNTQLIRNTIPDAQYDAGVWGGIDETGSWVWIFDLDAASDRLHGIIYGNQVAK